MTDLAAWVERISTRDVPATVAADVSAAQQARHLPSLIVVPGRETVQTTPMTASARHKVIVEVLVVTGIQRGNQALGGRMANELDWLRLPMLRQLIGWTPPPFGTATPSRTWYEYFTTPVLVHDTEVTWHGGQLLTMSKNALFWVDAFRTEYWWKP
ncbi:phage tail terminator protein [Marinobacter sp. MCTG268]|uniref:phage tail terminator protein n=1 Tax=Marinobacter adhaerens TaxID=1033846 RepID=UPI00056ADFEA